MGKNSQKIKESVRLQELKQYFTPEPLAKWMCENYIRDSDIDILEPSAGRGSFVKAIPIFGARNVVALEIDRSLSKHWDILADRKLWVVQDFFDKDSPFTGTFSTKYDLIIGNPPFGKTPKRKTSLDVEFVLKSLTLLKPTGRIVFLLESKFMHGVERFKSIWEGNASLLSYTVLTRRVAFEDEEGLLDSVGTRDCCIFEMALPQLNVRTQIRWINQTF